MHKRSTVSRERHFKKRGGFTNHQVVLNTPTPQSSPYHQRVTKKAATPTSDAAPATINDVMLGR